ncbi:MAG: TonB-dependent receptor [Bacteroidetes Order II. Incertae sedis bacterium]|nr:TonB-dependent receptor [Bacteroidetes Order II. bacterium]
MLRFFALLFLLSPSSFAQNITGRVLDANDQTPLMGATLQLRTYSDTILISNTTTDTNGYFVFKNIPSGAYLLITSFVGYETIQQNIHIPSEKLIEIKLKKEYILSKTIMITAQRAEAQVNPITFSNLTARDLKERPQTRDLPALLSELPSVTYYSENGNNMGYAYLRMRGFDQRRIAVTVNGIPQNDAEDHNVYWINFFDQQEAITDIQVQRGAGSAFYGSSGIGGAINILADPYKKQKAANFTLGYGNFNTRRYGLSLNTGANKKGTMAFFRLSRVASDGYREGSWTDFWRYFAGVKQVKPQSSLTLQAWGGPQKDGLAYYGIDKKDNSDTIKRRTNYSAFFDENEWFHQPHFEVLYDQSVAKNQTMSHKLYAFIGRGYFDFDATWRTPNYFRLPNNWGSLNESERNLDFYTISPNTFITQRARVNNTDLGWLPSWTYKSDNTQTTLGGEVRWHRSEHWGRIQDASPDIPEHLIGEADARVYNYRGKKWVAALYASHFRKYAARIQVQSDVQVIKMAYRLYNESFFQNEFSVPYLFVNPRLGFTFNLKPSTTIYSSIALANREPRLKELYDAEEAGAGSTPKFETKNGNLDFTRPIVRPEHLLNSELGVSFRNAHFQMTLNGYFMGFRNEIVPSGGLDQFGVPRYGNAAETRHLGLEAEATYSPSQKVEVSGNAAWGKHQLVRFTEYNTNGIAEIRDGNPIALFPDLTANLRVTYRYKALFFALSAQHTGAFCVDNSGCNPSDPSAQNDAFTIINATIQLQPKGAIGRNMQISMDINNLLNHKILLHGNESRTFFPLATRNTFVQIRYTLQ